MTDDLTEGGPRSDGSGGHPVSGPAAPVGPARPAMDLEDPVTPEARTELSRLAVRWQQLPLDRALERVPLVRAAAQRFADDVCHRRGLPPVPVPDLGPAALIDQLTVLVYDASRARRTSGDSTADPARTGGGIAQDLADLRRALN